MRPGLLAIGHYPEFLVERFRGAFDLQHVPSGEPTAEVLARSAGVRAIAALGESVVDKAFLAQFPATEIIAVYGVGYDGIDTAAARERNIAVTHTPDVLTADVADFALALLLSTARKVVAADRFIRRGDWPHATMPLGARVNGTRLGIIGLGRIGRAVARRALAFDMSVAYTDLRPQPDVPYAFHPDAVGLARAADHLVVCAYGGPTTRGLVGANVLQALGPAGFLINVARGSVVDEEALVRALAEKTIAGAGLDVFATEPHVQPRLMAMENVVLTPHAASGTEETRQAMADLMMDNLQAHFAGRPLLTPVPTR